MDDDDLNLALALSLSENESKGGGGNVRDRHVTTDQERALFTSDPFIMPPRSGTSVRTGGFGTNFRTYVKPSYSSNRHPSAAMSRPNIDEDYALAKRLQDEEKHITQVSVSSTATAARSLSSAQSFDPSNCQGCGWPFITGSVFSYNGKKYHDGCFKCTHCQRGIKGRFALYGEPPRAYHEECADAVLVPTCTLCTEKLRGLFHRHPFFTDDCYCTSHEGNRKACFSCRRREPLPKSGKEGFSHLPDGRALCMDCARTAIVDSSEAKPLYDSVVNFMDLVLRLPIPPGMRSVPILAVDLPSLNEQRGNTSKVFHSVSGNQGGSGIDSDGAVTRGLTLKECGSVNQYSPGSIYWDGYSWVTTGPRLFKTEEVRAATAVLVLVGLPSDVTASILAHEAMHVWCSLTKDFPFHLPPQVEEGLCQLIAFKYMEHIRIRDAGVPLDAPPCTNSSPGRPSGPLKLDWDAKLRAFVSNQIVTDPSEVYGDGFRKASECSEALGLEVLLNFIKDTGKFPEIK